MENDLFKDFEIQILFQLVIKLRYEKLPMKFQINQILNEILLLENQFQFQVESNNTDLFQIMTIKKIIFPISIANMIICKLQNNKS